MAYIFIPASLNIKDNGSKTFRMVMEFKLGLMDQYIKAIMLMGKSKVKESLNGLMDPNIPGNLIITLLTEQVHINGVMVEFIKENG